MKVLFVASEAAPFIKTGGLADVMGALPKALQTLGIETALVIPNYQDRRPGRCYGGIAQSAASHGGGNGPGDSQL